MGKIKTVLRISTYTILASPLVAMVVQYYGPGVGGG